MSESKKIVLGVSGSIAAHKAIDLASLLTKAGCVVDVVLTRDAQEFVKSLPFQTLTRRRVITSRTLRREPVSRTSAPPIRRTCCWSPRRQPTLWRSWLSD